MSRHRVTSASCPLFPSKRTFISALNMSAVPKADSVRGLRMPCLAPWRCREVSPSQEGRSSQGGSSTRKTSARPCHHAVRHDLFYWRGSPLCLHYGFERLRPITV